MATGNRLSGFNKIVQDLRNFYIAECATNKSQSQCVNIETSLLLLERASKDLQSIQAGKVQETPAHPIDEKRRKEAAYRCLELELKDHGDGGASSRILLPLGKDLKNCIRFKVPLAGKARLVDVRLPDGFTVTKPASFEASDTEGRLRAWRLPYLNAGMEDYRIFEVTIGGPKFEEGATEVIVDLVAIDMPARP